MPGDPRKLRTRQKVLPAAYQLLTEVGFDGVTIELISQRSGVARSTLYRHWSTKSEILRDAFAEVSGATSDGPAAGLPAARRLGDYAASVAEGLTGLWGRAALTLAVSAVEDDEQRAVMRTFTDGMRRDLLEVIRTARDAGELSPSAELPSLADRLEELVVAPMFYRYAFTDNPATPDDARRMAEAAWESIASL